MKQGLLLFLCLLSYIASAQGWDWAKHAGSSDYDDPRSIAADDSGNIYMTGRVGISPTIFLSKYDTAGTLLWTKTPLGQGEGTGVDTDASGCVFITGYFLSPTMVFDSIVLTSHGYTDIFVAKYDPNGNVLWAISASGYNPSTSGQSYSLAVDLLGNIIICGSFYGPSFHFGSLVLNNAFTGGSGYNRDLFIVKFDPAGNTLWGHSAGTPHNNENADAWALTTDNQKQIYMTGAFSCSTLTFGSEVLVKQLGSNLSGDMFVVKFDMHGNTLWAHSAGDSAAVGGHSIAVDAAANVYVAGAFSSHYLSFGSSTLYNPRGSSVWYGSMYPADFLVKYDYSGNVEWARSKGSNRYNQADAVTVDPYGTTYVAGTEYDTASASLDMFLLRYDPARNLMLEEHAEGDANGARALTTDDAGNVYVTGFFSADSIVLAPHQLNNLWSADIFLAKWKGSPAGIITSVEENRQPESSVYPNPSSGLFTIQMANNTTGTGICIYDLFGRCVLKKIFPGNVHPLIDLGNQPKGMYLVQAASGKDRMLRKVIVE